MIILSETRLKAAIDRMLSELKLPRPEGLTTSQDKKFKDNFLKAYIESVKELDDVGYCYGFDMSKV